MKPNLASRQSKKQWSHSQIANGQFPLCFMDTGHEQKYSSPLHTMQVWNLTHVTKVTFDSMEDIVLLILILRISQQKLKGGAGRQVNKPSFWWISVAHTLCASSAFERRRLI